MILEQHTRQPTWKIRKKKKEKRKKGKKKEELFLCRTAQTQVKPHPPPTYLTYCSTVTITFEIYNYPHHPPHWMGKKWKKREKQKKEKQKKGRTAKWREGGWAGCATPPTDVILCGL